MTMQWRRAEAGRRRLARTTTPNANETTPSPRGNGPPRNSASLAGGARQVAIAGIRGTPPSKPSAPTSENAAGYYRVHRGWRRPGMRFEAIKPAMLGRIHSLLDQPAEGGRCCDGGTSGAITLSRAERHQTPASSGRLLRLARHVCRDQARTRTPRRRFRPPSKYPDPCVAMSRTWQRACATLANCMPTAVGLQVQRDLLRRRRAFRSRRPATPGIRGHARDVWARSLGIYPIPWPLVAKRRVLEAQSICLEAAICWSRWREIIHGFDPTPPGPLPLALAVFTAVQQTEEAAGLQKARGIECSRFRTPGRSDL